MTKRIRAIIVVAAVSLAVLLVCLTEVLNVDKIYVWGETLGLFRQEMAIVKTEVDGLVPRTLDELGKMENVTVD